MQYHQPHKSEFIFETHYESYEQDVIQVSHEHPILVDMWAEWCPPCLAIAPVLAQVIDEYKGQLTLAKVEVDEGENMKLAGHYQVRGFPTILLIKNGEEKARFSGAKPKHFIQEFIAQHLDH